MMEINFYYFNFVQFIFLVFYIIYYGKIPSILEFLQSFLTGLLGGLILLLFAPWVVKYFNIQILVFDVFFKAAFLEKFVSFLLIFTLVFSFHRKENLTKIIMAGIQYAAGFAFLENIIYLLQYESRITYLRLITSVPMHLSTCGIQSYFIGLFVFYSLKKLKIWNLFLSILVPVFFHGFFDFFTFQKEEIYFYFVGPIIVVSVFVLEVLYSKVQTFPDLVYLQKERLRLEDWITLQIQKGHSQWILYSSGTKNLPKISFFRFQKDYIKIAISLIMLIPVGIYIYNKELYNIFFNIPEEYKFTLFFLLPISFFLMFLSLGSVNPEYFKNKKIRIPIVLDVEILLPKKHITTAICYEIHPDSTFLHSEEEFKEGETVLLIFSYKKDTSFPIQAKIIKYIPNMNSEFPSGIIVSLNKGVKNFNMFYYKYIFYRFRTGLIFLLNLPGSRTIRSLFVRPLTVMQNERFYRKGEFVFHQGDTGKHFYLIKKGSVGVFKELENGKMQKISELRTGEIFGEMALISDVPRTATVQCLEDTILAIAHKDHLEALVQSDPQFAMSVIHNLIKMVIKREEQLEEFRKLQQIYMTTLQNLRNQKSLDPDPYSNNK